MRNEEWKRALALETKKSKATPLNILLLLIGITPGTKELWAKGTSEKISIVVVSLIISSFTIGLPALLTLGITISKVCVPGNRSFETGTGLCVGNGKKEAAAKALEEKKEKLADAARKQKSDTQATYRAMRYICEAAIKGSLREPGSYERIDSTFYGSPNGGSKKGVIIEYRARNGFGGMNIVRAGCLTETGRVEDLKLTSTAES